MAGAYLIKSLLVFKKAYVSLAQVITVTGIAPPACNKIAGIGFEA